MNDLSAVLIGSRLRFKPAASIDEFLFLRIAASKRQAAKGANVVQAGVVLDAMAGFAGDSCRKECACLPSSVTHVADDLSKISRC